MNYDELYKQHFAELEKIGEHIDFTDWYNFQHDLWIKQDRTTIPLKKMTNEHIVNSIFMLSFDNENDITLAYNLGPLWLPKLKAELKQRLKEKQNGTS